MATKEQAARGALAGTRVVDLTRYASGPVCTQTLGDMGAEVIKVEPLTGDPSRWNPPVVEDWGGYFPYFNRNKKSLALDMTRKEGQQVLTRLVKWGDLLVENFRPGVMDRLGFSYEKVKAINPRLIVVSVSGFGQTGPYAQRAAFDYVCQAMGGVMSLTGDPDGPPMLSGGILTDMIGGLYATIGALAALQGRERTGRGQVVEASLYEGVLITITNSLSRYARGMTPKRGKLPIAPVGTFLTSDDVYMFIMAHDNSHFPHVARLIGRPELLTDPEYKDRAARNRHVDELNKMLADWVRAHTIAEVGKAMDEGGVPYGRVQDMEDILNCPHLKEREAIVRLDHGKERALPLLAPHPRLRGTPSTVRSVAPHLGEHTYQVCHDILGYTDDEVQEMRKQKVIK